MQPTVQEVTTAAMAAANTCLDECLEVIEHVANQLTDEQIWWRHDDAMNSIGNLMLHLAGNVRQWLITGLGDSEDRRDRPAEFAHREVIPKETLLQDLQSTVAEAQQVISSLTAERLLATYRVQSFEVSGWQVLFNSIPHFKGHTQEIVAMARMQLGSTYQFQWQPATPEEGAP